MYQLRLDSLTNSLSELQRSANNDAVQAEFALKLQIHRNLKGSGTSPCLGSLPLPVLRAILEYSPAHGRLAISHTNRALRAAVHANKDIFADLSFQNEYRGSLLPAALRCLLEYTNDDPLKLAIHLPLQSPLMQRDEILLVSQPHLARTRSLYLGAYWGSIQLSVTDVRVYQDRGAGWRMDQLRATWRSVYCFLQEPAPQLKRARITSGSSSSSSGPFLLPGDLFGDVAPSLRGIWIENVLLPAQPVLALCRIQDFSYSPHPSTLTAAQLGDLLRMMPELQALELYVESFEPDSAAAPPTPDVTPVPLRVFRLEYACSNMDDLLLQIQAAAGPNLRTLVLYDAGEDPANPFWFDSILSAYQRVLRIVVIKYWIELDLATDYAPDQIVVMRAFTSEDDPPPQLSGKLLRSADRMVPGSLSWLTSLTMHEFLWPCEDTEISDLSESDADGWYPLLPALTDLEIIMGAPDDYAYMFNDERMCLVLASDIMGGASMPRLARLTLSHRVRNREDCESFVDECTCERLLTVSLADLFELVEILKPESARLEVLVLRGLDPVDLDLNLQLKRLGTLADELQLVPLPDLKNVVSPHWSTFAWPEDPRGIFNLWTDSPPKLREISFLGD